MKLNKQINKIKQPLQTVVHMGNYLLKMFLENLQQPAWITDKNYCVIYRNEHFNELFSIPANPLNNYLPELVPESTENGLLKKHMKLSGNGVPLAFSVVLGNNQKKRFLAQLVHMETGTGEKLIVGTLTALSAEIKDTLNQITKAVGSNFLAPGSKTNNWEWDMVANKIYRSEPLIQLIGNPKNIAPNLIWWLDRIHPGDILKVSSTIQSVIEEREQYWECEYRLKNTNGTYLEVMDRGFILYEADKPVRFIGNLINITEKKQAIQKKKLDQIKKQIQEKEVIFSLHDKEKNKIGEALNENINQLLAASKMIINNLKTNNETDKLHKSLAVQYLNKGIAAVKKIYIDTRSQQPLFYSSFEENIQMLISELQVNYDIKVKLNCPEFPEQLHQTVKDNIFKIIQEQFKNIKEYSKAKTVKLTIQSKKGGLKIQVTDNGIGFADSMVNWGLGFASIRERVKLYNGTLIIKRGLHHGCDLKIDLPIQTLTAEKDELIMQAAPASRIGIVAQLRRPLLQNRHLHLHK
jgi:signal transduction histidine kinase